MIDPDGAFRSAAIIAVCMVLALSLAMFAAGFAVGRML
jgi:hypothetical protein